MSPPESIDAPHAESPEDAIAAAAAMIEQGRWHEAMSRVARLLAADHSDPEANLLKGLAEAGLGRLDDAERSLRRSIDADPGQSLAWESLAAALERRGAFGDASDARLEAWRRAPQDARLAAAAAGALFNAGRLEAAADPARAAAGLAPDRLDFTVRLAELLALLDRRDEAVEAFDRVLAKDPTLEAVRMARGVAALPSVPGDRPEVERATASFRASLETCAGCTASNRSIDAASPAGSASEAPRSGSAPSGLELFGDAGIAWPFLRAAWCEPDPIEARRFAAIFTASARSAAAGSRLMLGPARASRSQRLRVGILSGLWCDHVVAHLFLEGWMRHLDRSRFEVVAIDLGRRRDAFGEALLARADRVERGMRPFAAWARTIESLGCDAILWPEIGIEPVATRLAALRLAPVQAVAWGHPESTGLASIDVFLSGDAMEPEAASGHYSEELRRLPRLGAWIARPEMPAPRAALDWPVNATVFWCAQTPHKHHPRFDALHASIAAARPGSRFVFSRPHGREAAAARFERRLGEAFAAAGADPVSQLEFLPRLDTKEFRARLAAADVFLDPPGWSGGHTTLEAIAAGVPVLTLPGAFLRRRHAQGILTTLDPATTFIGDLLAADEADFVRRAIGLSREPERRRALSSAIKAASARVFEDLAPIRALEAWIERAVGRASEAG